jgi:hypothetical protein
MTPVLYILMRSDLDSMNPGKAMAQASHAANAMVAKFHDLDKKNELTDDEKALFYTWQSSTPQGFGTAIVLDALNEEGINDIIFDATVKHKNNDFFADIINDPTYPVRDGAVTHYISVNTCGYVFANTEKWKPNKKYSLHK